MNGGRRRSGLAAGLAGWVLCGLGFAGPAGADSEPVAGAVDGEPILLWEVETHLRPTAPWVGIERPPDPRRLAFEEAVRVKLLIREARRRGLPAGEGPQDLVEARLVRGLLSQEVEGEGMGPAAVSEAEARAFFAAHREALLAIVSSRIAAVAVSSPGLAEDLLRRASGASDAEFLRLVEEHSVHPSKDRGGYLATIDEHGAGLDPQLARVAVELKRAGDVGLAQGGDGLTYLLRASEVKLEDRPWDEELAQYARNLIAFRKREAAERALLARLRGAAAVEVRDAALDGLAVPSWETYVGPSPASW